MRKGEGSKGSIGQKWVLFFLFELNWIRLDHVEMMLGKDSIAKDLIE